MNPENDRLRHFILSQRRPRAIQRKIYTPKYFSLMFTMIIMGETNYLKNLIIQPNQLALFDYVVFVIAIVLAFIITSFSSFIGHRILYILSYTIYSGVFLLIRKYGEFLFADILFLTSRYMLFSQIIIQIYGTWPHKFGRIFVEMLLFYYLPILIFKSLEFYEISFYYAILILIAMIIVNFIWLVCGQFAPIFMSVNDYKSPVTDSVFKDFRRSIINRKIFIFTLLYLIVMFSLYIEFFIQSYSFYQLRLSNSIAILLYQYITIISSLIILLFLANLNLKPSLMIFCLMILLVIFLLIFVFVVNNIGIFTFFFLYLILLFLYNGTRVFMISQYWQILINIGIINLDFISSYYLLADGLASVLALYYQQFYYNEIYQNNLLITIPFLIAIIIILSYIFFQILGFKKYFSDTNKSAVEEDNFQIEIV